MRITINPPVNIGQALIGLPTSSRLVGIIISEPENGHAQAMKLELVHDAEPIDNAYFMAGTDCPSVAQWPVSNIIDAAGMAGPGLD